MQDVPRSVFANNRLNIVEYYLSYLALVWPDDQLIYWNICMHQPHQTKSWIAKQKSSPSIFAFIWLSAFYLWFATVCPMMCGFVSSLDQAAYNLKCNLSSLRHIVSFYKHFYVCLSLAGPRESELKFASSSERFSTSTNVSCLIKMTAREIKSYTKASYEAERMIHDGGGQRWCETWGNKLLKATQTDSDKSSHEHTLRFGFFGMLSNEPRKQIRLIITTIRWFRFHFNYEREK